MKVILKASEKPFYPLVRISLPEEKKFEKEFYEDVRFRRVVERGKEIIYGSLKSKEDSLKFGSRLVKYLRNEGLKKVCVEISEDVVDKKMFLEGAYLGAYEFLKYKKKKEEVVELHLLNIQQEVLNEARIIAEAVYFARDLSNEPPNNLTPSKFVEVVRERLGKEKSLKMKVLGYDTLRKKGFGGIVSVGKGSANKPCLLVIEYFPKKKKEVDMALVGKGVCFDAGGLNLKPTGYLEDMKMDMSGAAVTVATLWLAARKKLKANLVGIIPLVENVPSANSTKPGDIIRMFDGKTVEVVNTDAEGRLILADAIAYAEKTYKPEIIVDLATLTGGIIIALGKLIAGVFGNDRKLLDELRRVGEEVKEYLWELPLPEFYEDMVKGEISDLKNVPSPKERVASSIVGGLFLKQFVKKARWVHLDIAGVSILDKEWEWMNKGGTGFGVRLLYNFLRKRFGEG